MVTIRLAGMDDVASCAAMSQIPELATADGTYLPSSYFLSLVDMDQLFFVAEDRGTIVGYVLGEFMKGNVAYLGLLTVAQDRRGQGIGSMLLKRFEERCVEENVVGMFFYAPRFNPDTLSFYEQKGYTRGKEYVSFLKMFPRNRSQADMRNS